MSGLPRWAAFAIGAIVLFLVATLFHGKPHQVLDILGLIFAACAVIFFVLWILATERP